VVGVSRLTAEEYTDGCITSGSNTAGRTFPTVAYVSVSESRTECDVSQPGIDFLRSDTGELKVVS